MRSHDIVLFGATGFTGKLVAEYLVKKRGTARLAFAGRDRGKLDVLARELGANVPLLVADAGNPESLAAVALDTKVVCTTVGPYAKYGSALVAACAAAGTDYCDLTGELQWVRRMIDAHHREAERTGARIVHCCGFDSIPSDLGVHVLQARAKATYGSACSRVTFGVRKMKGGASGGTIASMMEIVEEAKRDPAVRRDLGDAYSLCPGEERGPDPGRPSGVAWDADLGALTGPFVMGAINERVVRRTNALSGYTYGRNFSYRERMCFPRGPKGLALAVGTTAGIGAFLAAAAVPPVRKLLQGRLPAPGEGPSAEQRERGFFEIELIGKGTDSAGKDFGVRARVGAQGDPGYSVTSRMLGESALCLAFDDRATGGGVLTPAFALGDRLVRRLRAFGMTLEAEA